MGILVFAGLGLALAAFFIFRNLLYDSSVHRALQLASKGRFQESLDLLNRLLPRRKNIGVLWGIAKCHHGLKNEAESVKFLKQIPLAEVRGNKYFNTMEYYLLYADVSKAMALYQDAIKYLAYLKANGFDFWTVNLRMAEVFYLLRDLKKAVHHLFITMEQNPKSWEGMLLLTKVYFEIRNFPRSADFGERTCKLNKSCLEARLYAGLSYYKMDKYAQCVEMLEDVAPPASQKEEYLNALGMSHYRLKDYASAYDKLEKLLGLLENYHVLYKDVLYKLAHSAEMIGRFKESFEYWKNLYSLDPKYSDVRVRYRLAELYDKHESFRVYLFSDPSHLRPFLLAVLGRLETNVLKIIDISRNIVEAYCEIKAQGNAFSKILYRFIRGLEVIDRKVIDLFHFEMKQKNCAKGVIYTVGDIPAEVLHQTHVYSIEVIQDRDYVELLDSAYKDYKENMSRGMALDRVIP
jgi:tetratricopeptide (TPR) repeat protein